MARWTPEQYRDWCIAHPKEAAMVGVHVINSPITKTKYASEMDRYEAKTRRKVPSPQPEQVVRHEPLGEGKGKEEGAHRVIVRIKSFRIRLCDTDNLCAKSLLDGLRYSKLIPDDRPQDIELTVTQEKCSKKDERTEILIEYP